MKQRTLRDTKRVRRVDREGWADLSKVRFETGVNDTTLSGVTPCTEPLIKGVNVLKDPSFEKMPFLERQGVRGMTFPGDSFSPGGSTPGSLAWTTEWIFDRYWYDVNGWATFSNNESVTGSNGTPYISDVAPRTGRYHWRVSYEPVVVSWGAMTAYPIPISGSYCELVDGLIQGYSARCEPGDTVTTSIYCKVNTVADGPYEMEIEGSWFDRTGAWVANWPFVVDSKNITTNYQKFERAVVAPAGAYTVAVGFYNYQDDTSDVNQTLHFDFDDASLVVT